MHRKPRTDVPTVTVRKKGARYTSEFSKLPGQTFGPYDFAEMIRDLHSLPRWPRATW